MKPRQPTPAASIGESIVLNASSLMPEETALNIVAEGPEVIDTVVDALVSADETTLLGLVTGGAAKFVPNGRLAKVVAFTLTPRRQISCALIEVVGGAGDGLRCWIVMDKRHDPTLGSIGPDEAEGSR